MPVPLNKIDSEHVLENGKCKTMAQVLFLSGPSVGVTGSSLHKLKTSGEPSLVPWFLQIAEASTFGGK